jgi:phage terminase large subunit
MSSLDLDLDLKYPVAPANVISDPRYKSYQPFGTAIDMMYDNSPEFMYCGPSGTGKSRGILEKIHILMCKYPGARTLIVRKTRSSLTESAMITFDKFVLPADDSVHFRTGEQEYRYANGSVVVVGGMDKAVKVMSSEYDLIYAQEAIELTEEDWETLTVRCRYGVLPHQQVIGDCNPSYPSHWIKLRADRGQGFKMINSRHQDNPVLYDQATGTLTPRGEVYMAKLNALTGVRKKRYLEGIWAAAEGMIYTEWDADKHVIDRFPIPSTWSRYWVIDFGFTHPFVWQAWAVSSDGTAYRYAEIYRTHLLVEDACEQIKTWRRDHDEPYPTAIICDHDAEDRATFERHMNMDTTAANKQVLNGLHSVMTRLRTNDDTGKPGFLFLRDSVLEPDAELMEAMKPCKTEDEFDGYEWEDHHKKETPKKVEDDGMDDIRYLSVYLDEETGSWSRGMAK